MQLPINQTITLDDVAAQAEKVAGVEVKAQGEGQDGVEDCCQPRAQHAGHCVALGVQAVSHGSSAAGGPLPLLAGWGGGCAVARCGGGCALVRCAALEPGG